MNRTIRTVVSAVCAGAATVAWSGDLQLYRVSASGESGIDLLALGDGYRKDGFEFYATSSTALEVKGAITHAAIPDGGWFDIVGNGTVASPRLNLWNTGLFTDSALNTPIRFGGKGTVDFYEDVLTLGSDWAKWISWVDDSTAILRVAKLIVTDVTGTPLVFAPEGAIRVGCVSSAAPVIRLGQDGGRLTAVFDSTIGCYGVSNSSAHDNNSTTMYIGGRSVATAAKAGYANVTLNATDAQDIGKFYFSSLTSEALSQQTKGLTNILTLACGTASLYSVTRFVHESSIIRFAREGAALRQYGQSGEMFRVSSVKDNGQRMILESVDGTTIKLVLRDSCTIGKDNGSSWYASDIEVRGTGNIDISVGGVAARMTTIQADKIAWNASGDLVISPLADGSYLAYLNGTDALPHGAGCGDVVVKAGVEALVNADQSFNSLTGGGTIRNTAASPVAFAIGCDGEDTTYEIVSATGSVTIGGTPLANAGWTVTKKGAGDLTLRSAPPSSLVVEDGDVIVPVTLPLAAGSLALPAGSKLRVVNGATLANPTALFADATESRTIVLEGAAVLQVGGDGADETVDLANVSGDASTVIRKVGSNKVTLENYGNFRGSIVQEEGTIVPTPVDALTWTGGAGANTSFAALANWGLTEAAILRGFTATFATGGETATLAEDTPLAGIIFDQTADGKSGFAVDGTSKLILGAGGVTSVLPGSDRELSYVLAAPVEIQASQTWTVADNGANRKTSLTIAGPLSSSADGLTVTKSGAGAVNLCATGSTSTAAIDIPQAGTVRISGDNAWGGAGSTLTIGTGNAVEFGGGMFEGDMKTIIGTSKQITTSEGSTNVFRGSVVLEGAHNWTIGENSLMEFHKPLTCGGWSTGRGSDLNSSIMRFFGTCTIGSGQWNNLTMDYRAANNEIGSEFVLRYGISRHLLNCEWAWNTDKTCQVWLGSIIDLCGHNNKVGTFQMKANGVITNSGEKAIFWTNVTKSELKEDDSSGMMYPVYIRGDLRGPVSLGKMGPCDLTITNRAVSSSGDIVVAAGRLAFCPASNWLNAEEVIVTNALPTSGAVLEIRQAKTLGKAATVRLGNGGKLRLGVSGVDASFRQTVAWLYIDGVLQPSGYYSADRGDGTPIVPGTTPCSSLEGPGVLKCVGNGFGLILIVR